MNYELLQNESSNINFRKGKDRLIAIIASILCIILSVVIIILAVSRHSVPDEVPVQRLCTSEECVRSAADIILSMNTSVDPCDDFYRFTCDRWSSVHPDIKWFAADSGFTIVEEKLALEYIKVLQSNDSEDTSKPVRQSKDFFRSCLDQVDSYRKSNRTDCIIIADVRDKIAYKPVFKLLSQLGLPAVPRFFNMSENHGNFKTYKFDWIKTDTAMNKLLDVQLLIDCNVEKNMFNSSMNTILCSIPERKLFGYESLAISKKQYEKLMAVEESVATKNNSYNNKIAMAQKYFKKFTIMSLLSEKYTVLPDDFDDKILVAMDAIDEIDSLMEIIKLKAKNSIDDYYHIISINDLQEYTDNYLKKYHPLKPKIIWKTYFEQLFDGMNVSLDLDNKDMIHIPDHSRYYLLVAGLLAIEEDTKIELWAWWMAVKNLMIHTTSKETEILNKLYISAGIDSNPTKEIICAGLTKNHMDFAVASALVNKSFFNTTKPKVEKMLHNIKNAFEIRVNALNWMDESTKELTIEKSREMTSLIGFPEWLLNKNYLEKFYSTLTINADTYLENLVQVTKFKRKQTLERLHHINNKDWHNSPLQVNAYNSILGNFITIPFGIINYPYYNRGLEVLNYASLGNILGHELTHGFDNRGRKFDKHGNYKTWWSDSTIEDFVKKALCFVQQYNDFYVPEVDAFVNGSISLGENLADNGGLHLAYLAYQNHKKIIGEEMNLPGLEKYTNDQLFFISYANIWCDEEKLSILKMYLQDSHCPHKYRVIGNLMNSEEFVAAFNCPAGSKMNPFKSKCQIW